MPGRSPLVQLDGVSLEIPLLDNDSRSLKRKLVTSITGGHINVSKGHQRVKALSNINLTLYDGDRVALIGHNGSGKSTLLRILSQIYYPTEGQLTLNTKIYPLLSKDLLTHPDLSGYHAAKSYYLFAKKTLKGFNDFLDTVAQFSELGDFIHLPVKTYSEGMTARLVFTLLTSFQHQALALDEGFGTGDAGFFAKAQQRLSHFLENTGLLVLASHSDQLLTQFCNRGLVLSHGTVLFDGPINQSLDFYHASYH